ncbi:flagellar assembly protein FliW [Spirochaeta lutea]|uniref:Flagellar assembly factor FliW n=1 Tax=Spirochaeta lutea TaxID=1480694 RepID=A0A098R072_9SPIO|nr:flagellar assembly protein FliW [Spirochaeta lutea]KGE73565.1 flagellar assembly protein FliW [Spirochaeta lutea]
MRKIVTKAYGPLEVDDRQFIQFPSGILGFEALKEYALIDSKQPPFLWLQSVEDQTVAFVVISPLVFRPDFVLDIPKSEYEDLHWEQDEELLVLAIVTIPPEGGPMTANLQGPVIINRQKRIGKQGIQLGSQWRTRHNIIEELSGKGGA